MPMRLAATTLMAVLACVMSTVAAHAQTGGVTGRITASGLRSSADVVVSLEARGLSASPPAMPVAMDQQGMKFIPHVLPVVTGTTVRFLNNDPVRHNVFSPEGHYNLGNWPRGEIRDHTFDTSGVYTQLCRRHDAMEAFVVVLDTPFFSTTDPAGAFEITNVPPGDYTLVAWSETLKTATQIVTVTAGTPVTVSLTLTK
jgi:plastocyanin